MVNYVADKIEALALRIGKLNDTVAELRAYCQGLDLKASILLSIA